MAAQGPELRDIHLPPAPSWWPPAPGWWLVAVMLLAAASVGLWYLVRAWRERRWRRRVLSELDRIAATHAAQPDAIRLAGEISELLRRAVLLVEPRAAALEGEAWLEFLDRELERGAPPRERFRSPAGRALIDAPYRRPGDQAAAFDAASLLALSREWLKRAVKRRRAGV